MGNRHDFGHGLCHTTVPRREDRPGVFAAAVLGLCSDRSLECVQLVAEYTGIRDELVLYTGAAL